MEKERHTQTHADLEGFQWLYDVDNYCLINV